MIFTLVRHASYASSSTGTLKEEYAANAVQPLTPFGVIEAEALAHALATRSIDVIVHSPFQRAVQTAEIIASRTHAPRVLREDLHEHRIILPHANRIAWKAFREALRHDHALTNAESESFDAAASRYIHALDSIRASGAERPCVVAHALVMEAALSTLFHLPRVPHIDTGSITTIEYAHGRYHLLTLNERPFSCALLLAKMQRRVRRLFAGNRPI